MNILKIPVHIHPAFWLLAAALGWINSGNLLGLIIWVVIIILSILIHEYGHALTAIAFKQRAAIELVIYGGLTRRTGKPLKRWQEFIVVLNGPLAGALLGAAAYAARVYLEPHLNAISLYALDVTWQINFFWTVVNLLPVFPLDGGQLLAISLQAILGLRGLRLALLISTFFALSASLFFFYLPAILAGALFLLLTFESYKNWRSSCTMTATDQNPAVQRQLHLAEMFILEGNVSGAENLLTQLIASAKEGVIHNQAVTLLAKLKYQQGQYKDVVGLLKSLDHGLDGPQLELLVLSAIAVNDLQIMEQYGSKAYQEYPNYQIAVANARYHARLDQVVPAIGWLQCAIRDGLPNPKAVIDSDDFNTIRKTEAWAKLDAFMNNR